MQVILYVYNYTTIDMILNTTVNRIAIETQTLLTGQRTTNWCAVVRNRIADFNYALTMLLSSMSDINTFSTKHLYDCVVSLCQTNACTKITPRHLLLKYIFQKRKFDDLSSIDVGNNLFPAVTVFCEQMASFRV